jgi:hypothetical protein
VGCLLLAEEVDELVFVKHARVAEAGRRTPQMPEAIFSLFSPWTCGPQCTMRRMNSIVTALGIPALRTRWRKWAVVVGGAFVLLYVLYRLVVAFVLGDANQPASEQIVAAVETYKLGNKRYPEKLSELQPKYLPKIPHPAPDTNFVYATSSDGTIAWFGYQTQRGTFIEYDSRTRKWQKLEYSASDALQAQNKEFVTGPK